MKVSSWRRMDPNVNPVAAKGTGIYINSSLAKVEALKAGYDEAILLNTQGYVAECTGENLFVVKDGVLVTPPLSRGALEGITRDSVMTIARDLGVRGARGATCSAATSTSPTRRSSPAPPPRSCPIRSVDDREIGEPGEITRKIQETYFAAVRGEVDAIQGLARACLRRVTHRDHGGSRSTTRRCATAPARGHLAHRRRQAAHRRAARLARRRLHRGRLAGRQPEGRRDLPARCRTSSTLDDEHAGRVRLDAAGEGQGRLRRHAAPPARRRHRRRCASSASRGTTTSPRRCRPRSTRAWRWSPTRSSSCAPTAARCSSTPSTSSTATGATPSSACACSRARPQAGATRLVLCDTNGGTLPHDVERIVREVVDYFGGDVGDRRAPPRRRRHRRGQRARRRARRRDPGAGHDQRLRRAHRQLQPHDDHPEPHAEDGDRDDPRGPARAAHAGRAPRRRAREHGAQPAGARTSARRRSRTRPGCTSSAIVKRPDAYEHVPPDSVGNGTRFVVSELAGKTTLAAQGEGARPRRSTVRSSTTSSTRSSAWSTRATTSRWPTRRSSCSCGGPPAGSSRGSRSSRSGSSPTTTARRRRPAASTTEATIKVHVGGERVDRDRRGQRPGERARHRAAQRRSATATRRSTAVHLTDYKVRVLDTAKGTGAVTRVLVDSTNGDARGPRSA